VRLWDTETGTCVQSWAAKGTPFCAKIHPKDGCVLAGCSNKNIVQWDPRQPPDEFVQEYVQHLGSVNTITFIDEYRRVVSTGDDKKLFVWEYGIGTAPMKHVSEPWMHSMPAVTAGDELSTFMQSVRNCVKGPDARSSLQLPRMMGTPSTSCVSRSTTRSSSMAALTGPVARPTKPTNF
jgi:pre-mRNA-processing factor 17